MSKPDGNNLLPNALPIDSLLPSVTESVSQGCDLIVTAEPGAGKTTRVPLALAHLWAQESKGKVLVLQPRRLAARLAAQRLAQQLGQECGQFVGYRVRRDAQESEHTRVLFVTEGICVRMGASENGFSDVACIVLDEFHERHIQTDLCFVLAKLRQHNFRSLRIVVMSATLDVESISPLLHQTRVIHAPGRVFPVRIDHLTQSESLAWEIRLLRCLEALLKDQSCPGHILVFLASLSQIEAAMSLVEKQAYAAHCLLLPLYADLPLKDQQRVFDEHTQKRKIIFSTNVAETSVTIAGVTGVIDAGDAMVLKTTDGSGLPELVRERVSQASCAQRAGRAGRTAPGVCKRLFTDYDFRERAPFTKPEILRLDLCESALLLLNINSKNLTTISEALDYLNALPWPNPPAEAQWKSALAVLELLGFWNENHGVTAEGRSAASFNGHPRLAKLVLESTQMHSCRTAGLFLAALFLEGRFLQRSQSGEFEQTRGKGNQSKITLTPLELLNRYKSQFQQLLPSVNECLKFIHQAKKAQSNKTDQKENPDFLPVRVSDLDLTQEHDLAKILVHCFPDRVVVNVGAGGARQVFLAVERQVYFAMEWEDLQQSGHPFLTRKQEVMWDAKSERMRCQEVTRFADQWIESRPIQWTQETKDLGQSLFLKQLQKDWPAPFFDLSLLEELQERLLLCKNIDPAVEEIDFLGSDLDIFWAHLSESRLSYEELRVRSVEQWAWDLLSYSTQKILEKYAPDRIKLPSGRTVKVNYEKQKAPWIASKLQDFFGTLTSPQVLGHQNVVIHLGAPNGQTIQTTSDLQGFWTHHYDAVRREYQRRYPGHFWPEDPASSEARVYKNPKRS